MLTTIFLLIDVMLKPNMVVVGNISKVGYLYEIHNRVPIIKMNWRHLNW